MSESANVLRDQKAMTDQHSDGPYFTGITSFQDPQGRYSIQYPSDWACTALENDATAQDQEGVSLHPDPGDSRTFFAITAATLPQSVTAEDLPLLTHGFDDGLAKLPDLHITSSNDNTYQNIVQLERNVNHAEGVQKIRVLYADDQQITITWQGSTEANYDYWLPMANYCFATFELAEALWYATDPELHQQQGQNNDE